MIVVPGSGSFPSLTRTSSAPPGGVATIAAASGPAAAGAFPASPAAGPSSSALPALRAAAAILWRAGTGIRSPLDARACAAANVTPWGSAGDGAVTTTSSMCTTPESAIDFHTSSGCDGMMRAATIPTPATSNTDAAASQLGCNPSTRGGISHLRPGRNVCRSSRIELGISALMRSARPAGGSGVARAASNRAIPLRVSFFMTRPPGA